MTRCVLTLAVGARALTSASPVGTTVAMAHVLPAVIFTLGQCVCMGLNHFVCVLYKYSDFVPRIPREFAGLDGECVACHPECKPQSGRVSCTGRVIVIVNQIIAERTVLGRHKCWKSSYCESHASFVLHFPDLLSGVGRRRVYGVHQRPRWSLLHVVLSHGAERWPEGPGLQIPQQRGPL